MIFIPSRGRRRELERFFRESKPMHEGRVLIDEDDIDTYLDMELPCGWSFIAGDAQGAAGALRRGYALYPDESSYGVVGDDVVCSPAGWDELLVAACGCGYVAWGDDGRWGQNLCTTFFVGGDLVRRMGWLVAPGFGHLFVDRVWHEIAWGAQLGRYLPEVKTVHRAVKDATWRGRRIQGDAEAFNDFCRGGHLRDAVERAAGNDARLP